MGRKPGYRCRRWALLLAAALLGGQLGAHWHRPQLAEPATLAALRDWPAR